MSLHVIITGFMVSTPDRLAHSSPQDMAILLSCQRLVCHCNAAE